MPNIMKKQKEQMELSLYYHAVKIELEVLHSKEITHDYLCHYFYRVIILTSTTRFHIGLINQRWYKDIFQETNILNKEFVAISSIKISALKIHSLPIQFLNSNGSAIQVEASAINTEITKSISKKRKFGKLWI
ncbi:hypothetical protein GLOIN_2v1794311 [Rhizophagus irregularis DAOM 181602=DAOM 197198]|nr:hypothetical protein GLOIN_2v1794311 [Rhizophagus irregularis DAOM 181602=DAOM 197198]